MHYGGRNASRGSVMLWVIFCWETLGPGIDVGIFWYTSPTEALLQTKYILYGNSIP